VPNPPPNLTMSDAEVAELRQKLAMLAQSHVQDAYKKILGQMVSMELPTPRMIQEFVTTWKLLWKYKWK
jgi:hypothetical protein